MKKSHLVTMGLVLGLVIPLSGAGQVSAETPTSELAGHVLAAGQPIADATESRAILDVGAE